MWYRPLMDPQETLKRWRKAVAEGDRSEAAEFAGYLRDWLARGGFEPTWHDAKERAKFVSETREARDTRNQREIEAERNRLRQKSGGNYFEGVGWYPGPPGQSLEDARAAALERGRRNPSLQAGTNLASLQQDVAGILRNTDLAKSGMRYREDNDDWGHRWLLLSAPDLYHGGATLGEKLHTDKKHVAKELREAAKRHGYEFVATDQGIGFKSIISTGRQNPTGMGLVEAMAWGLAAAGVLYLVFKPAPASAAIVPASAARIPPAAQPRAPVTDADRAAIVGVQDRLRAVGYQPGPSTGTWTHDTNYAIAFLQRDEGLPATGVLDGTTAQRLAAKYARVQAATASPPTPVAEEEGFWSRLLTLYG